MGYSSLINLCVKMITWAGKQTPGLQERKQVDLSGSYAEVGARGTRCSQQVGRNYENDWI